MGFSPLLEARIERIACQRIRNLLGIEGIKFEPHGSTGWPDRIFFVPGGRPLLIEFKRPGEPLSPKQALVVMNLRELGYDVHVCTSAKQALAVVELRIIQDQKKGGPGVQT